jgi:hypothetical protein
MVKQALPVIDKVGSPEMNPDVKGKARFYEVQINFSYTTLSLHRLSIVVTT